MQEAVIPKQQQYRLEMVDTWRYQVSIEWYWLVLGGTESVEGGTGIGSVEGSTGPYLVVLGQKKAILVDT